MHRYLLLCILFFMPIASGDIVSDILRTEYLDCAYDLEYFDPVSPEINMQHSNHIYAWVDIVGFKNMTYKDGVYYIPGSPENNAMIYTDKYETTPMWNCGVDSFTDKIAVHSNDTHLIVDYRVDLTWHESKLKLFPHKRIKKTYFNEHIIISDAEPLPKIYDNSNIDNTQLIVTVYNNSVSPKTTVHINNIPDDTLSLNYSYGNDTLTHYLYSAQNEYTSKNIPYMNLSSVDIWDDNGNLSRYGDIVVIPDSDFRLDYLNVTIQSPYESHWIQNVTITNVTWNSGDTFSSFFVLFISICGVFITGIYINLRRF